MNLRHLPRLSVLRRFFDLDEVAHHERELASAPSTVNLFSADREMMRANLAPIVAGQVGNDAFQAARRRRLRIL